MVRFRLCPTAAALALAVAAPAEAGWWPSGGTPAPTSVADAAPRAVAKPVTGTTVPEPADFALFAAGVVGLLLGRRGSRSRRD